MTARFLTPLRVQFLDEWDGWRQKIVVLEPLRFWSEALGRELTVPAGFVCDRESMPTRGPLTGREMNPAGVLHDWLYQSHELPRRYADEVYQEALLSMGLDEVRAAQRYQVVDDLGESAYESGPSRKRMLSLSALITAAPYGAAPGERDARARASVPPPTGPDPTP